MAAAAAAAAASRDEDVVMSAPFLIGTIHFAFSAAPPVAIALSACGKLLATSHGVSKPASPATAGLVCIWDFYQLRQSAATSLSSSSNYSVSHTDALASFSCSAIETESITFSPDSVHLLLCGQLFICIATGTRHRLVSPSRPNVDQRSRRFGFYKNTARPIVHGVFVEIRSSEDNNNHVQYLITICARLGLTLFEKRDEVPSSHHREQSMKNLGGATKGGWFRAAFSNAVRKAVNCCSRCPMYLERITLRFLHNNNNSNNNNSNNSSGGGADNVVPNENCRRGTTLLGTAIVSAGGNVAFLHLFLNKKGHPFFQGECSLLHALVVADEQDMASIIGETTRSRQQRQKQQPSRAFCVNGSIFCDEASAAAVSSCRALWRPTGCAPHRAWILEQSAFPLRESANKNEHDKEKGDGKKKKKKNDKGKKIMSTTAAATTSLTCTAVTLDIATAAPDVVKQTKSQLVQLANWAQTYCLPHDVVVTRLSRVQTNASAFFLFWKLRMTPAAKTSASSSSSSSSSLLSPTSSSSAAAAAAAFEWTGELCHVYEAPTIHNICFHGGSNPSAAPDILSRDGFLVYNSSHGGHALLSIVRFL